MPLIVENGSGVLNANSYIDLAYLANYATSRGYSLPLSTLDRERFAIVAMDYLESYRDKFKGVKSFPMQPFQWPRENVFIDGTELEGDYIPEELKKAQCQLVIEQQLRTVLFSTPRNSSVNGFVTQETVGPLTIKYTNKGEGALNGSEVIRIAGVEVWLSALISTCRTKLETVRV